MGCCQAKPPPTHVKGAFSDFTKKNEHHTTEGNYTLSSANKTNKSDKYYQSRSTNIKSSNSAELHHLQNPSSRSNSSDHSANSTKQLLKNKKPNRPHATSHPLPFKKQTFESTLSPDDANANAHPMQNRKKLSIHSNTDGDTEREPSLSKSRSRRFRRRTEPRSPSDKNEYKMSEPPPIFEEDDDDDDDDDASSSGSSLSDEVEIPGLKPIVFFDEHHDDDEEDDENLKIMELLVQEENERLMQEIHAMKDHIYEQETIKLKREAMQEIMKEMAAQHQQTEEEKKRKAMERYEKKQKQRLKEMEEAKQRRRLKKEEKKKKKKAILMKKKMAQRQKERLKKRDEVREQRKKELETYAVSQQRPTKQEIITIFDKYFYTPFEDNKVNKTSKKHKASMSSMTDDSDTDTSSDEEELGEGGIDFEGFKAGLKSLGIDTIISKSEIETLFDHIGYSSRAYGINAVDFCHFLKANTVTLEPKIATLHRKVLSTLSKQQDKEDAKETDDVIPKKGGLTIQISVSGPVAVPPQITVTVDEDEDEEETSLIMKNGAVPETPTQKDFTPTTPKERRDSVSMTESMTESVLSNTMTLSQMNLPSNIPRKSFKQINYNWNDSISTKSFNNYKRLRQKFGLRYAHTTNKTKDEELMKIQEQLMRESMKDIHIDLADDNDDMKEEIKADDIDIVVINHKTSTSSKSNKLPGIDETKPQRIIEQIQSIQNVEDMDNVNLPISTSPRRSAVKSLQRIEEYEGNKKMMSLRKLYQKQHKMKQKLERLRKRSLLHFPAPPKPKKIDMFMNEETDYICKELQQCICKNTRYTGLANFGPNGELGIELEFTSDCDDNGYIIGKRVISFKGMKQAHGKGRVWTDVTWNGHKYVPCTRFEWIDEEDGVTTKFEFDSVHHEIDVDHSFFQGKCVRYPSDLNPKRRATKLIMHEGFFDFVCVSARRRSIRRNSLLQYYDTLDVNELDENELKKVPKYVRRMSAYTDKIDKLYESEAPVNRDTLFGDAISTVAAIGRDRDTSVPEQINE